MKCPVTRRVLYNLQHLWPLKGQAKVCRLSPRSPFRSLTVLFYVPGTVNACWINLWCTISVLILFVPRLLCFLNFHLHHLSWQLSSSTSLPVPRVCLRLSASVCLIFISILFASDYGCICLNWNFKHLSSQVNSFIFLTLVLMLNSCFCITCLREERCTHTDTNTPVTMFQWDSNVRFGSTKFPIASFLPFP